MFFKSADFIIFETKASSITLDASMEEMELGKFKIVATAGLGSGPQGVFDLKLNEKTPFDITAIEISSFVGEWMTVGEKAESPQTEYIIFSDVYGYCPIFYSFVPEQALIVSDSFFGVHAGLKELGIQPSLDFKNYVTALSAKSNHFANPNLRHTMANEIKVLSQEEALLINSDSIKTLPRTHLERASRIDSFEDAITEGIEFVSQSLKTLFNSHSGDNTLFLSGGVDSRMLLALCLHSGLQDKLLIRSADPRDFKTPYSHALIKKDIQIANTIRGDLDLKWWMGQPSTKYELSFRESLMSFQSYKSNFSYTYHPQPALHLSDQPVIALRGGGGEMLRSTNNSLQVERKILLMRQNGEIPPGPIAKQIAIWFMKTGRVAQSFSGLVQDFMQQTFETLETNSISESLNAHYLSTRNRTHFGHLRASHMGNEIAFHFLSNEYFRRAAELCSPDERAEGLVARQIFHTTGTNLEAYPFESEYWTSKLTPEKAVSIDYEDESWKIDLDHLRTKTSSSKKFGWNRQDRGVCCNPISDDEQLRFVNRCFQLIETHSPDQTLDELRSFHKEIMKSIGKDSTLLGAVVAKVASAADVYFPMITQGSSIRFTTSPSSTQKNIVGEIKSAKPSIPLIPQDGWNNIPFIEFKPSIFYGPEGIVVSANISGPTGHGNKFAFYLYRDGIKIDSKWYGEDSQVSFSIEMEPGVYDAIVFCRTIADRNAITEKTGQLHIG